MYKNDLIDDASARSGIPRDSMAVVVEAIIDTITSALKSDESIRLIELGTFSTYWREDREHTNPRTGESIFVPRHKYPKFKTSKRLKDIVNGNIKQEQRDSPNSGDDISLPELSRKPSDPNHSHNVKIRNKKIAIKTIYNVRDELDEVLNSLEIRQSNYPPSLIDDDTDTLHVLKKLRDDLNSTITLIESSMTKKVRKKEAVRDIALTLERKLPSSVYKFLKIKGRPLLAEFIGDNIDLEIK